jgi:peptidoglycan-associated lipoprotein
LVALISTVAMRIKPLIYLFLLLIMVASACRRGQPPVARPTPPPPPSTAATVPPDPPAPMREPMPPEPVPSDDVAGRSLDDLNRSSPLQPVFFEYDSSEIDDSGRSVLQTNAAVLKKYPTWVITIEGHCDERGTAEYNLALGERRAVAARTYLISLGIDANRLRTVSYGSEFPFDPAHQANAWSLNRRAHFVITAK